MPWMLECPGCGKSDFLIPSVTTYICCTCFESYDSEMDAEMCCVPCEYRCQDC